MRFELVVELNAKRNKRDVLNRVIERAADAVMKERTVQEVHVRCIKIEEVDDDGQE